jgi:hypothetical protein
MSAKSLHTLVLASIAVCFAGQQPNSQTKPATTASGVFLGKSGKPMAGVRLLLCQVDEDQAKVKLQSNVPTATVDPQGRFTIRGFDPGKWTIVYLPAGANAAIPNEIDVSPLEAVDNSILPLIVRAELGSDTPYPARPWGRQFTLLKGHTFWSMGAKMKIWNATARRGQEGPFLELRRGAIWKQDFRDKCEIKFDAWSF